MNKTQVMLAGVVAILGCGHEEYRDYGFPVGVYSGTVALLAGAVPGCSMVADPNLDACCDDTQAVALSVSLYSDGYYVDAWPASIDATGRLYWQESFDSTDSSGCAISGATSETMTQNYAYSYASTTTQNCSGSVVSVACAYSGQLRLQ